MAEILLKGASRREASIMKMEFLFSTKSGHTLHKVATFSLGRAAAKAKFLSITPTILAAAILTAQQAGAQTLEWASSYNGIPASALEEVEGVVADAAGNVFATGLSGNGTGSAICTMKLNSRGTIVWSRVDTKSSLCGGMWGRTPIAQDAAGNLIVVGAEFSNNMSDWNPLMLKYGPDGTTAPQRQVFDLGPFASFDAIALDASSEIYVLAHNNPNNGYPHIVHTLKLGPAGSILWTASFTPGTFWGTRGGIVVTASGVYTAAGNKVTKRDLATGAVLWEKDMTMSNGGSPLAADGTGNIFVVPYQGGVTKYDAAGNVLSVFSAVSNLASDIDVDGTGNIYIVGSTVSSKSGSDMFTQKYNSSGTLLWNTTYGKTGQYSDQGIAITVRDGYVYVGGSKYNKNLDMCTLKYRAGN